MMQGPETSPAGIPTPLNQLPVTVLSRLGSDINRAAGTLTGSAPVCVCTTATPI